MKLRRKPPSAMRASGDKPTLLDTALAWAVCVAAVSVLVFSVLVAFLGWPKP